jgi:hypothetical protein
MKFKRGDKVMCIDADFRYGRTSAVDDYAFAMIKRFPRLMEIYTVRETPEADRGAILLCELLNPILVNAEGLRMEEIHWHTWRFVKLPQTYFKKSSKHTEKITQLDLFLDLEPVESLELAEQK